MYVYTDGTSVYVRSHMWSVYVGGSLPSPSESTPKKKKVKI